MMKIHFISFIILFSFIFAGCSDSNNKEEDLFDLEWNKGLDLEENMMVYIDDDGSEHTINIENMEVCLFQIGSKHYIEIDVNNEILYFIWDDESLEISTGIIQLHPYALNNNNLYTEYRGMLNIVEVLKGEWDETLSENPISVKRNINIKAIFHFKKNIYQSSEKAITIDKKEMKGIFYYSGVEKTGAFVED